MIPGRRIRSVRDRPRRSGRGSDEGALMRLLWQLLAVTATAFIDGQVGAALGVVYAYRQGLTT
jgi:hypothetical protein